MLLIQIHRNISWFREPIFLSTLFILTLSLFIIQTANYYGFFVNENPLILFFKVASAIVIAYGFKMLSIRMFGSIFQNQKEGNEYAMTMFLFCNTLGLFMLPIVVGLAFVKDVLPEIFIYTGIGLFVLFLVLLIVG